MPHRSRLFAAALGAALLALPMMPAQAQLHQLLDSPVKGPAPDAPGDVINSAPSVAAAPLGIAENTMDGELKVLDLFDGNIYRFNKALAFQGSFAHALAGFTASGIAYNDDTGNYYLMNGTTGQLQEANPMGGAVGAPCAVPGAGLPAGVAYDPTGTDSNPSLWFIDIVEDTIYEMALPPSCAMKSSFLHPLGAGVFGNGLDVTNPLDPACVAEGSFPVVDILGGTGAEGQVTRAVSTNKTGAAVLPDTPLTATGDNFMNDLVRVENNALQVFFVVGNGTGSLFEMEAQPVPELFNPMCGQIPTGPNFFYEIPTLNQVGLTLLVLMLAGAAVFLMIRRRA